jgi:hypothetical protein
MKAKWRFLADGEMVAESNEKRDQYINEEMANNSISK